MRYLCCGCIPLKRSHYQVPKNRAIKSLDPNVLKANSAIKADDFNGLRRYFWEKCLYYSYKFAFCGMKLQTAV